ncbi:MAG TPA: hypothetical protein VFF06_31640 [Polyangia bacterium]|nr:hypothetical protein [Polyangia bacterium]
MTTPTCSDLRFTIVALAAAAALVDGACAPGFPPPVAGRAPPELVQGLRVMVYRSSRDMAGDDFPDAVARAFRDAGVDVVTADALLRQPGKGFDVAIRAKCEHYQPNQPLRCYLEFSLDVDDLSTSSGNRYYEHSWTARDRTIEPGGYAHDLLAQRSGPLRVCFAAWEEETTAFGFVSTGGERRGVPLLARRGLGVGGPHEADSDAAQALAGAAYLLVNKIVKCPGFAALAKTIKESGVGVWSRLEDLPTDRLMKLCAAAEKDPPDPGAAGMIAAYRFHDACELAAQKDPAAAARIDGMRVIKETTAKQEQRARCLAEFHAGRRAELRSTCAEECAGKVGVLPCLAATRTCAREANDDDERSLCASEGDRCLSMSGVANEDLAACVERCAQEQLEAACR